MSLWTTNFARAMAFRDGLAGLAPPAILRKPSLYETGFAWFEVCCGNRTEAGNCGPGTVGRELWAGNWAAGTGRRRTRGPSRTTNGSQLWARHSGKR